MIDYRKDCSILFFFKDIKGNCIIVHYERPQYIDDFTLTAEAKVNSNDMLKRKIQGIKHLVAIAIARSDTQNKDITKRVLSGNLSRY